MSYKVFDVVELINGDKATILDNKVKNKYKAEIVNENGISKGFHEIEETEIKKAVIIK